MTISTARLGPRTFRAAGPFILGGATLAVIGGLTWFIDSWPLRAIGLVAVVVGCYVLLVGVGLMRIRTDVRRREVERAQDEAILATVAQAAADDCAQDGACTGCDTVCALRH